MLLAVLLITYLCSDISTSQVNFEIKNEKVFSNYICHCNVY